ncbi:MAG: aminotransferase class IV [Betaproteobacteria bacterium]
MMELQNGCFRHAIAAGSVVDYSNMTVHAESLSMRYGISLFEGVRGYLPENGQQVRFFELGRHLERLADSCSAMGVAGLDCDSIARQSEQLLALNMVQQDCYLRIAVNLLALEDINADLGGNVFISLRPMGRKKWLQQGSAMSVHISARCKPADEVFPQRIKNISNYAGPKLALDEAKQLGFDSVLLRTPAGTISEAPTANLFVVNRDTLLTPPVSDCILRGITRDTIMRLATGMGIKVEERSLADEDLEECDEAFLCGTGLEIGPIGRIGRRPMEGERALTRRIVDAYFKHVRSALQ